MKKCNNCRETSVEPMILTCQLEDRSYPYESYFGGWLCTKCATKAIGNRRAVRLEDFGLFLKKSTVGQDEQTQEQLFRVEVRPNNYTPLLQIGVPNVNAVGAKTPLAR